jgi:hypothetical protein
MGQKRKVSKSIDSAKFRELYRVFGDKLNEKIRNAPSRWLEDMNENAGKLHSFLPQDKSINELEEELQRLTGGGITFDDLRFDHSLSSVKDDTQEVQEWKIKQRQDALDAFKEKLKSYEHQQFGRSSENAPSKARSSTNNKSPGFDYVKKWKSAFAIAKKPRTSFSDQSETDTYLLPFYNKLRNHRFDRFIWPAVQYRHGNPAMARQDAYMDDARWKTIDTENDVRKELTDALAKNHLVLMHDDAGMGKTAFSWMLFEHLLKVNEVHPYVIRLEGIWPRSTDENKNPLPIMELVLEELLGKRLQGRQVQGSDTSKDSEDGFREAVRENDVFILLDGFDQMTNDDRAAALEEIRKTLHFESVIPKCHWLVSGRPFSFLNNELSTELFGPQVLRLRLKKFDQTRQDKYFDDLSQNKFFLDQPKEKRKPLDFMCSSWKNEATESDLGVPLHLSEIRKLIEDFLTSPSNDSSSRTLSEVYSSSDLHARVSQVYLQRAVIHSKAIVAPLIPKTDALKIDVLRQICGCLAMQMMLDENYNGSIDNTTTRLATYRNLGRINIVDAYLERSRNRYEQSRTDNESYWDWGVEVLRTIEVTHRGDIDVFTHEYRSFRDKKAMEWYAAYYLVNHCTPNEWIRSASTAQGSFVVKFIGAIDWNRLWQLAMEMPSCFYSEKHLYESIKCIFTPSQRLLSMRPGEWMWIAWRNRLEQDELAKQRRVTPLENAMEVIQSFRQEFIQLVEDNNPVANRLQFNSERDLLVDTLINPNQTDKGWYRRIPDKGDFSSFYGDRPAMVTVSQFWLRKFAVTNEELRLFDPLHYTKWENGGLPASSVTWYVATMFCCWLGEGYRLPTEAEWETACRANRLQNDIPQDETIFWFGDNPELARKHVWFKNNSHQISQSLADSIRVRGHQNAYGLFDMSGNIEEWCSDRYGEYSSIALRDPNGPSEGVFRVHRGGCWESEVDDCRSAVRSYSHPGRSYESVGFRIAFSLAESPKPPEDAHEFERSNDTDQ